METLISLFYVLAGFVLRLTIPIVGTVLLVLILRRLDARWQAEAKRSPAIENKQECWKVMGCSTEQMENCPAVTSPLPCWQVNRLPNGYLNEKCMTCKVFIDAPVPTLTVQPRRL